VAARETMFIAEAENGMHARSVSACINIKGGNVRRQWRFAGSGIRNVTDAHSDSRKLFGQSRVLRETVLSRKSHT
jgi:hypothetical protein